MSPSCYTPWGLSAYLASVAGLGAVSHSCLSLLESPVSGESQISLPHYLKYFIATCVLEAPLYVWLLRSRGFSWHRAIRVLVALNLLTHPLVFFGFPLLASFQNWPYGKMLAAAEVFAPSVEALALLLIWGFWNSSRNRAIATAVIANLASWGIGVFI